MRVFLLVLASATCAACNVGNQEPPLTVIVYPSEKRCAVKLDEVEQTVECAQLGNHLRDSLKIALSRQIDVSFPGSENVSKEDQSIDRIADVIRSAGFTDVRTWRFGIQ